MEFEGTICKLTKCSTDETPSLARLKCNDIFAEQRLKLGGIRASFWNCRSRKGRETISLSLSEFLPDFHLAPVKGRESESHKTTL